jgi:hypothetical protein
MTKTEYRYEVFQEIPTSSDSPIEIQCAIADTRHDAVGYAAVFDRLAHDDTTTDVKPTTNLRGDK